MEVAALKLTGDHIPATCRVEPSLVRTFDNMTVPYQINDCEHVLLLDGSRHIPVAVTTKTVEAQKKVVKILSGVNAVQMIPTTGDFMKVMLNGEQLTLPAVGEQLIKKNPEGKIILIVHRYEDVILVHIPEQMLKVLSNGSVVEVVAPQLLKSRAVGLCGDMNGERSAELRTPAKCVLRPRLAALSFMLNKSGTGAGFEHCSGLPAALKEEFVRESTKCPRMEVIPTPAPISILNMPPGMRHIVDKQSNQLCISKQMIKPCLSKPLYIRPKSVEYVCVPYPSIKARSLEKRALAGESLIQEVSQLPTIFRRVEFEPLACRS